MTSDSVPGAPLAKPPASHPRLQRITAVVNQASGSVGVGAAEALSALVAEHGYQLDVSTPAPNEVEQAVRAAVDGAPDLLLVLAGDGTARLAAELCGPDGPLVAPLPGGTLNMLPRALYGALKWREALAATLTEGVERDVSGGKVDGHAFYVAAILGTPALWGKAREAIREGNIFKARRRIEYALRRAFTGRLHYGVEGGARRGAEALVLIAPLVSRAVEEETALEVAALDYRDALAMARLAFTGLVGEWRRDPSVTVELCDHGWAETRASIPAILDGEAQRLPHRVAFEFTPKAFRVLAPAIAPQTSL